MRDIRWMSGSLDLKNYYSEYCVRYYRCGGQHVRYVATTRRIKRQKTTVDKSLAKQRNRIAFVYFIIIIILLLFFFRFDSNVRQCTMENAYRAAFANRNGEERRLVHLHTHAHILSMYVRILRVVGEQVVV